jgi:hypothetical protein
VIAVPVMVRPRQSHRQASINDRAFFFGDGYLGDKEPSGALSKTAERN